MRVTYRKIPQEIDHNVAVGISHDIARCLQAITTQQNSFVVNDTHWYALKPSGRVGRVVVNNAGYMSKKFQDAIESFGIGEKEKKLVDPVTTIDQAIDGYVEKTYQAEVFSISQNNLVELVREYWIDNPEIDADIIFMKFYQMYFKRKIFTVHQLLPKYHRHFTTEGVKNVILRIGIEFETGNIGSSYRAFSKLGTLYRDNLIDAAVFTTSVDKVSCAERIWPTSNRNGSFAELDNRGYERNIIFPLWELAFAPDSFSQAAEYLKSDGSLYSITPKSRKQPVVVSGVRYGFYNGINRKELVKQI